MNNPKAQLIIVYNQIHINSHASTVTNNHEGSRPLVSVSTAIIIGQIFLQKLYNFTHRAVIPNAEVREAHYTSS